MSINWRVSPKQLLDDTELQRVNKACELLNCQDGAAIDSYKMGEDGPYLNSIYLLTQKFLMEVRLDGDKIDFDVAASNSITNYRISIGEFNVRKVTKKKSGEDASEAGVQELGEAPAEKTKSFNRTFIRLTHTEGLATEMNYFAADGEDWLKFVLEHCPFSLIHQ